MKYFLLETNPDYKNFPHVKKWYGKIDIRNMNRENAYQLPRRELLFLQEREHIVFTDIILEPFLLVTSMVKEVIGMYEPHTIFKEIILLDQKNERSCLYHLPILEEVDCLAEESECSPDRSIIKRAVVNGEKTEEKAICKVAGVKDAYYIGRLDFVESIWKRGAKGIGIKELEIREDKWYE